MITLDLVRTRREGHKIIPQYIDVNRKELLNIADNLIAIYEGHYGKSRGELHTIVDSFLKENRNVNICRGLCRLLDDRSNFDIEVAIDPVQLREDVFSKASQYIQGGSLDRDFILKKIASDMKIGTDIIEKYLYADLKNNHIFKEFKSITSKKLLQRYNTSLAQAILLRATNLEVCIKNNSHLRFRQLFRSIKFYRLLYQITGNEKDGFIINLDGPMSLFQSCQKYGLQMALFLPALLLCENWELKADLKWKNDNKIKSFLLDSSCGLVSHYSDTGMYEPPEFKDFKERFEKLKSDWKISNDCYFLDFVQAISIPDYKFTNVNDDFTIYLEVFGFWRKSALEKRILHLQKSRTHLILAVSKKFNVEESFSKLKDKQLYVFSQVLSPKKVLEHLDDLRNKIGSV